MVALLSLRLCWQLAQGSLWKDGSRNSPPCRASSFSVCAGTEGVGLWDFSSHHFCLVKQVIAQINPNTKSSHPALRHQAGGDASWGKFIKQACFLSGCFSIIWAQDPIAALERCRAALPRMGLQHWAMGCPLASHGLGTTLMVLREAPPLQPYLYTPL